MQPGRNTLRIRKRLTTTATILMLVGAAFFAAAPANAALNLGGAAAGSLDSVWGMYGHSETDEGEAQGSADGGMSGSVSSAAEGAADVAVTPPDPPPTIDEAQRLAAEAKAEAEAQAAALLAQKENLAAAGAAKWGVYGEGGAYDVVLGGQYGSGLEGLATASGQKSFDQKVDVRGHGDAANDAAAQAEGAINELIGTVEQLYGKLHASFDVGLDGALNALGSIGFDIAGLFGMQQGAEIANVDHLGLQKHVDVAAPAMAFERVDLPDVEVPELAVQQGGEVGADAAATAQGLIKS